MVNAKYADTTDGRVDGESGEMGAPDQNEVHKGQIDKLIGRIEKRMAVTKNAEGKYATEDGKTVGKDMNGREIIYNQRWVADALEEVIILVEQGRYQNWSLDKVNEAIYEKTKNISELSDDYGDFHVMLRNLSAENLDDDEFEVVIGVVDKYIEESKKMIRVRMAKLIKMQQKNKMIKEMMKKQKNF